MLTRSLDGNFHQYLQKRKKDSNDVDLIRGAYFPDAEEYKKYIDSASNSAEVRAFLTY